MPSLASLEQLVHTAGLKLVNSTRLYPALHQLGDAGLPMLVVENTLGRAVIALQGAHLMAFQPAGQREMLWVSPKCVLDAQKPIRGGIPLCLPWFGPGPDGTSVMASPAPWHGPWWPQSSLATARRAWPWNWRAKRPPARYGPMPSCSGSMWRWAAG